MTNDPLIAKRIIEQAFTNWINPELERRKAKGQLPNGLKLRAAQVIFSVDGSKIVRVNGEVKVLMEAKVNRKIEKGEPVLDKDVDLISSIKLLENEMDFGHITIIRLSKGWFVGFNFEYNVSTAKAFYDMSIDFMKSAHRDLTQKNYRPFIESLFVASENLSKARISLLPDKDIRKKRINHKIIKKKIELYSLTDKNIKSNHSNTFISLLKLRDQARYDPSFTMTDEKAKNLFESMKKLSNEVSGYLVRFNETSKKV